MFDALLLVLAGLSAAIWFYLFALRGDFWRARESIDTFELTTSTGASLPKVVALVPARNESEVIQQAVESLLGQDYAGDLEIIVADDHSTDGTAEAARRAAAKAPDKHLEVVAAAALPAGWTGKLWALNEARDAARRLSPDARYLWLSDADVVHDPAALSRLVAKAEAEELALVSQMVLLSCRGLWDKILIPPFVYFFQKLYPFAWVNDRKRELAAAAGGCILIEAAALDANGGFAAIKGELIDDCALARQVKGAGRGIWLGLTRKSISVRPYLGMQDIWNMVARSAFHQLEYRNDLLAGTIAGMAITYLVPPLVLLSYIWHGEFKALGLVLIAIFFMIKSYRPTLQLYGLSDRWALTLPIAGFMYALMTFDSARRHWRGEGGGWKGRTRSAALAPEGTKLEDGGSKG